MTLLTPIPEVRTYLVAVIAVGSLAPGSIAAQLRMLWPGPRPPSFLHLYIATMSLVGAVGLSVLHLPMVTQGSAILLAPSASVGLLAGFVAFAADGAIRGVVRRRDGPRPPSSVMRWSPAMARAPSSAAAASEMQRHDVATLSLLLAVAALEELLFRGLAVELSLRIAPTWLAALAIAGTVLAFAAGHVFWGITEVLAKAPLGTLALAASLPFHCLLGAVTAHAVFNTRAWHTASAALGPGRPAT